MWTCYLASGKWIWLVKWLVKHECNECNAVHHFLSVLKIAIYFAKIMGYYRKLNLDSGYHKRLKIYYKTVDLHGNASLSMILEQMSKIDLNFMLTSLNSDDSAITLGAICKKPFFSEFSWFFAKCS